MSQCRKCHCNLSHLEEFAGVCVVCDEEPEEEEMILSFNVTEVQRVAVRVTKEDAEYFKELFARHGKGGDA